MAKQETGGIFLHTKSGIVPFAGLTVCNLGADGGTFYAALMHNGQQAMRVSGATEQAAMKAASQVIADISKRIDGSNKIVRLVIEL